MRATRLIPVVLCLVVIPAFPLPGRAAEKVIDFSRLRPGPPPSEFRATVTGSGPAGEWKVLEVPAASFLAPLTSLASTNTTATTETVLAQLSQDPTDERFPLLVYEPEAFADFTATLRFRTVSGRVERMAGLAFRLQDERNYYIVRASSLGNTLRFYKFVDGIRSDPIGADLAIPVGEWHTLEVNCEGNAIRCRLDDKPAIPQLNDTSFTRGKFALWTKSDSVSHFASLRLVYDPLKTVPERLVESAMKRYPRLLAVTIFARSAGAIRAMASTDASLVGTEASESERRAIEATAISAGSASDHAAVVFPLRDRNGEPVFALRLKLRTFAGQTDANIAARGQPIAAYLQSLVASADRE